MSVAGPGLLTCRCGDDNVAHLYSRHEREKNPAALQKTEQVAIVWLLEEFLVNSENVQVR